MMTGLPGDSDELSIESGKQIAELEPDFVRIYPTVVIKGSILAKWYQEGKYCPMSLSEAVSCVKKLYLLFREKNISVIRMGLQASSDLDYGTTVIAGPYHPAFGHLVMSEIFLDKTIALMLSAKITGKKEADIRVHPKSISQFRGEKNGNIAILKSLFGCSVRIIPDASVCREEIMI
jgi:histone acetyltransferase (RNA polymerase elongator complex component)